MEYSVGSLADLITGSNTPNKQKVIQKEFVKTSVSKKNLNKTKNRSKVNDGLKKKNTGDNEMTETSNNEINLKKIKKKRKRDTEHSDFVDSDQEQPTKKAKLSQSDLNAERRVKEKKKEEKKQVQDPEELARTIFIGNVPISISKKTIKKHFKKYGQIESIRIRGIPVADPKVSKKVAAIKKEFHPKRQSVLCYIRYKNLEDAVKTEAENGVLFEGHHLRVRCCGKEDKPDETKAIFVGNLSFEAEEDELWKLFEPCGPISYVRIIRDPYTGMGKGFAYINFEDSDAVQLALEMEGVKLRDRELRVSHCNLNAASKNKKFGKKKEIASPGQPKVRIFRGNRNRKTENAGQKRFPQQTANNDYQGSQVTDKKKIARNAQPKIRKFRGNQNGKNENAGQKRFPRQTVHNDYQGSQFTDKKKKRKVDKGLLEKKKKIKKIAPK